MRYDVLPAPEDGAWEPVAAEAARPLACAQSKRESWPGSRGAPRHGLRLASDAGAVRSRPGVVWDERAERLARKFWPGALTLVLEDGSERGLAVRVDAHPFPRTLLRLHGGLMSSTSVNRSGEAPAAGRGPPHPRAHARARARSRPRGRRASSGRGPVHPPVAARDAGQGAPGGRGAGRSPARRPGRRDRDRRGPLSGSPARHRVAVP